MPFGAHLLDNAPAEWRYNYVDYGTIKQYLKEHGASWNSAKEARFAVMLEDELKKVSDFGLVKFKELESHLLFVESRFAKSEDPVTSPDHDNLKKECDRVAAEIGTLAKYNSINYTAMVRLLQKHDRKTNSICRHTFMAHMSAKPFYKVSFDSLIARLSTLYGRLKPRLAVSSEPQGGTLKTDTYWVHADNVTAVKLFVLQHMPVVVSSGRETSSPESLVSCIYLDNESHDMYHERVEKNDTAMSIRLRWFGTKPREVQVDTRSHREDTWAGEATATDSFTIKEKYLDAYLAGQWTFEQKVEKMRTKGMSDMAISQLLVLSKNVQDTILRRKLQPCVRTAYSRVSFTQEQPTAAGAVRVDFDTNIVLLKEEGAANGHWHRVDAGTDNPPKTDKLPSSDIQTFPYVVVTVTTRAGQNEKPPQWLADLAASGLVEPVPKFSKFVHACTLLLAKSLRLLPYWLPQLEKDLRQTEGDSKLLLPVRKQPTVAYQPYKGMQPGLYPSRGNEAGPSSLTGGVSEELDTATSDLRRRKNQNVKALKELQRTNEEKSEAPKVVAVHANPKVHLANERTFLHWLHTATLVATIALALMDLPVTGPSARTSRIAGISLLPVALLFLVYSLYLYLWRDMLIRRKDPGPYYSTWGPALITVAFVLCVLANYIVWFVEHGLNPMHWCEG
eukprot:comp23046_c0_seq1/m.36886 comp23046_c0_seq1/g.36886  ORF comp23046_c0_seq1/g.36886 comp23046_c0_seq1/m.36886 type:complete len:675 (-) comp23046_c0_seq1:237-2261(-)